LILRKIIKTAATRCHILQLKCTKFDSGWSSPRPLAGFKGPTSKGRGAKGMGPKGRDVRKGERRGGEGEGKEGSQSHPI